MSAGPAYLLLQDSGDETYEGFSYEETYQVFTTDGSDNGQVVLTASGLPAFGASFSGDPLSRVSSRQPIRQSDATTHWQVRIRYSRETGNQQDRQQPPTLRPVKRSASVRWTQRALMQDEDDNPIITAAKTPFNPTIEVAIPHPLVRFTRWESSFSTSIIKAYVGKVNSSTFGAYDAGWVMCTNIEASEEWEQDANGNPTKFWMVTYEFEACYDEQDKFRPLKALNADFWFLDPGDSNKRKPIFVLENGSYTGDAEAAGATPVPSPVPLSAAGIVLQASELPDDANYLEFNIYGEADFNALGLPVD